ncbi:putative F-box protein At1g47800 [Silene latifolia]|uniref:putative F-box protein At1g47800 n=1 Tax=Silene latifolia TaxID=37657 RepID=UPI003D782486
MSDASFEDIPEEIHIAILSKLPPKSLSRCKCVSKHWNDTLTIRAFLLNQSISYDKHPNLFFVALPESVTREFNSILSFELTKATTMSVVIEWDNCRRKTSIEEVIKGYQEDFIRRLMARHDYMSNICNDLICIFDLSSKNVGLLNVKTQDYIRLPAITMDSADQFIIFWYALGFDPVNKVFKVLCIFSQNKWYDTKASILTLGSKYWKPIEYECLPGSVTENAPYWSSNNSICLDGVIYWVNETINEYYSIKLTVVAFDLNRETFRDYELVVEIAGTFSYYLTSLKGCPTLFSWKKKSDEIQQLTLFNHKNPNVAWSRRNFIANDFPKIFNYGRPSTCVAGGSILLHMVRPSGAPEPLSCYIWYDLEKLAAEEE